jgi:UDP-N-acetylglucosamine 4,6-dehydratase
MRGKVILLTGGTGTFGRAFVQEALTKGPKQIRVFSRDELKQAQMAAEINDPRVEYLLGDIRDFDRLKMAMRGVDIVIHAAALKRVEKGQRDPQEFIKTNVQGTINVANACLENNVPSAILISSDKAVLPINVYGGSKFLAEQVWLNSNVYRGSDRQTKFSAVRYGNVCGSRGSIIRIWHDQAENGTIKVTDQRMTRFFLTIQQAIDLVQLALEVQQGGEIFLPKLKSVPIVHLASLVAGKSTIEYTGNRGGEKLHEVLATEEEFERMTTFSHYSIINPFNPTWPYMSSVGHYKSRYVTSETADQLEDTELQEMIAKCL